MKFKITPLLIVSIILIIYGLSHLGSGGNLGPLLVLLYIIPGGLSLLLYFVLRVFLKNKIWLQVGIEILIILISSIWIFNKSPLKNDLAKGQIIIDLPQGYKGCVFIVYGVIGKPKLDNNTSYQSIHLHIPISGIFLTSDPYDYSNSYVFFDSTQNPVKILTPGYGFPFSSDTLYCNNKKYLIDLFLFRKGYIRDWQTDSLIAKKNIMCDSINLE